MAKHMVTLHLLTAASLIGNLKPVRNASRPSKDMVAETGAIRKMTSKNSIRDPESRLNAKRKEKNNVKSIWKKIGRSTPNMSRASRSLRTMLSKLSPRSQSNTKFRLPALKIWSVSALFKRQLRTNANRK